MLFGNRRPRKSTARQRASSGLPARGERLEAKILLTIDLGGTRRTAQSRPSPPHPSESTSPVATVPSAGRRLQRRGRRRRPSTATAMKTS